MDRIFALVILLLVHGYSNASEWTNCTALPTGETGLTPIDACNAKKGTCTGCVMSSDGQYNCSFDYFGTIYSGQMVSCSTAPPSQPTPQEVCQGLQGQSKSTGYYDIGTNPSEKWRGNVACESNGCMTIFQGFYPVKQALVNGDMHYYAYGSFNYYGGEVCVPGGTNPESAPSMMYPPPATCSESQWPGIVNDIAVCLDKSTGEPVTPVTSSVKQSTTQIINTDGSVTTQTTVVNKDASVTKISNTVFPDGSSTREVTGDPKGDPEASECEKYPNTAGCSQLGDLDGEPPVPTQLNVSLNPMAGWDSPGACPADVVIDAMGQQIPFKFKGACDFFTMMRPVILAGAWIVATLIFVGGVRT
ncbi:MAG: hypothetical protein H6935_15165 [Thiobacillus sp.]|nr:hypothetical protein [Thiobacillus sp.]